MTKIMQRVASFCAVSALMGAGVVGMMMSSSALEGEQTTEPVPNPAKGIARISTMQEMTGEVCWNTPLHAEKQLTDTRDGTSYYVVKLADGNCWMAQNLALDINATVGLSSTDTDINPPNTVWSAANPGVDTDDKVKVAPQNTVNAIFVNHEEAIATSTDSWNLGKWVLAIPEKGTSCGSGSDIKNFSQCTNVGFVNVENGYTPNYIAKVGSWTAPNGTAYSDTLVAVDEVTKSYDPHYLVGNYYTWNTATAGSGGWIVDKAARDSICPKGWQLPNYGSAEDGSFNYMLSQYGVDRDLSGTGVDGKSYNIFAAPLSYVRNGQVTPNSLFAAGSQGYSWSRLSQVGLAGAFNLSFGRAVYSVDDSDLRYRGEAVRCLTLSTVDYSGDNGVVSGGVNNGGNNSDGFSNASGANAYKAPNTGSMGLDQQSARTVFALSAVAMVAGLAGLAVLIKLYFFSPLRRK